MQLRHLTWLTCTAALSLCCSCLSDGNNVIYADGFAARSASDSRWGVVDCKGRYATQNAYNNPPSAVISGLFTVENADSEYLVYDIDNPLTPINTSPFYQITAFVKDVAFATRRGTPIFTIDRQCNPLNLLPDTVWEVRLTGDLHTVAAFRDQRGKWGVINADDGSVAEVPAYDSYEAFCNAHSELFALQSNVQLGSQYANIVNINPLSSTSDKLFAVRSRNKDNCWMMVDNSGKNVADTHWRDYAFSINRGKNIVVQDSDGFYKLIRANSHASQVGDLDFTAVSCHINTSVKSGAIYPMEGCSEICDFLTQFEPELPDSADNLIPVASDASYYHFASKTFHNLQADVNVVKNASDKAMRLMAIVKITPDSNLVPAEDFHFMMRNLMFAIEDNIEKLPGWQRIGGESHALIYEDRQYLYLIPYNSYIVAVITTAKLNYKSLMNNALRLSNKF